MDKLQYDFIDIEIPDFNPEFFDLWLSKVVAVYEKEIGELGFIFCSDDYLLEMNREHLDHDYYTDVITFDYSDRNQISGDVFVSVDRVLENAKNFGDGDFHNELCRVMVHGVLHLIGFKDKTEEESEIMRREETKNLSKR